MSQLHSLPSIVTKSKKRVGRGRGSGKGDHTTGTGVKGQRSRVGVTIPLWFEGGQLPLIKRMPMLRGKGRFNVVRPVAEVSLAVINDLDTQTVTLETLKLAGVIDKRFSRAKVIAGGELTKAVTVVGLRTSASARAAIEAAGGKVEQE